MLILAINDPITWGELILGGLLALQYGAILSAFGIIAFTKHD